jgi:hypothetical protein
VRRAAKQKTLFIKKRSSFWMPFCKDSFAVAPDHQPRQLSVMGLGL